MEQTGTDNSHSQVVTFLESKRRSENYALFLETFDVGLGNNRRVNSTSDSIRRRVEIC